MDQFKFYTLRVSTFLESEDIVAGLYIFKGLFEGLQMVVGLML